MDRGTEATLTRTVPCSLIKSSTKDLSPPIFELVFGAGYSKRLFAQVEPGHGSYDLGPGIPAYAYSCNIGALKITVFQHGFGLRGVQP